MKFVDVITSHETFPTKKYIFLDNGKQVESVFIERQEKNIICLSCMYGCPAQCTFCKSGENYYGTIDSEGMKKMIFHILEDNKEIVGNKRTLFSFMGSGEPLLNYKEIAQCINFIKKTYENYSITISVSGTMIENLSKLTKLLHYYPKIQFSLHTPVEEERKKLIPTTRNIQEIIKALLTYREITGKNVTLNYVVLEGVNDTKKHIEEIERLVKKTRFDFKINEYHTVNETHTESTKKKEFIQELRRRGIPVEEYATDGVDIGAACGQLQTIRNN